MSGIVGFVGAPNNHKLDKMLKAISHRGDGEDAGLQSDEFTLAMRYWDHRDGAPHHYPIRNERQQIFAVADAHITNHRELKHQLAERGHKFHSDTSVEILVHAYEEWGIDFVKKLDGAFAFALYDHEQKKLFLARDYVGVKPLYFSIEPQNLVFASEIKAIQAAGVKPIPSLQAITSYLISGEITDSLTLWENIISLSPAHYVEIDSAGSYRSVNYWKPQINNNFDSINQTLSTEVKSLAPMLQLPDSYVNSLGSKVAVEAELSIAGGLLSSAAKSFSSTVLTPISELEKEAPEIHSWNQNPIIVMPTGEEFWQDITKWLHQLEFPGNFSDYITYQTAMAAGKRAEIVLRSNGLKPLFGMGKTLEKVYLQEYREHNNIWDWWKEAALFHPQGRMGVLKDAFNKKPTFEADYDSLNEAILYHINTQLAHEFSNSDKLFHKAGVTPIYPYMQKALIEYSFLLPSSYKLKGGWDGLILRLAAETTEEIKWSREDDSLEHVLIKDWLLLNHQNIIKLQQDERFQTRPYWDGVKALRYMQDLPKINNPRLIKYLWRALMVELWLRLY